MDRYVTRTFLLFLLGFILILSIAFGVAVFVGTQTQPPPPQANTALTN